MTARGLDHIVHAVRDLDAAAEFYSRAGFTVGARNTHPWGTANRLVQLAGFFVEILTVADEAQLARDTAHADLARLFGAFNRDVIRRGDGFSTLILESRAVAADVSLFAGAGIGCSGELRFSREGKKPDGAPVTVGFSLGFVRDEMSPHVAFAVMQQRNPDAFWNSEYQSHDNTARAVLGAVLVADNPTDHHIFLSAFTGERELRSTSSGVVAQTPRGDVEVLEPVALRDRFGIEVPADADGMKLSGLRLGVGSLEACEAALGRGGVAVRRHLNSLVIEPSAAFGATLIFEAM